MQDTSVTRTGQIANVTNVTNTNATMPFISNSTDTFANTLPEHIFEEPQPSSDFVKWLLDSPVGDWLTYFDNVISSIANIVVEQKSTDEHLKLMQHYQVILKEELVAQSEYGENHQNNIENYLTNYLINAKALVERGEISKSEVTRTLNALHKINLSNKNTEQKPDMFQRVARTITQQGQTQRIDTLRQLNQSELQTDNQLVALIHKMACSMPPYPYRL